MRAVAQMTPSASRHDKKGRLLPAQRAPPSSVRSDAPRNQPISLPPLLPGFLLQKESGHKYRQPPEHLPASLFLIVYCISAPHVQKTGLPNTTRFSESVYQISSPARDFRSEQGAKAKAYRVYVEPNQRGPGRKDPAEIILCQRFYRPRRPDPGQYSRAR